MKPKFNISSFVFAAVGIFASFCLQAETIRLNIFSAQELSDIRLSVILGEYSLETWEGKQIALCQEEEHLHIRCEGKKIHISHNHKSLGAYEALRFRAQKDNQSIFSVLNNKDNKDQRYYDDNLELSVRAGKLFLINEVDLENYVAGVVQSEARGISDKTDFYKVQAIISRTYAMNNLKRHKDDGFHLCDGVHCQAHKSRNNTPIILNATVQTASMVIVNRRDGKLITAAFYANSGGETANAKDVWSKDVSYLQSVVDTFSLSCKSAKWEKTLSEKEWLNFLSKKYSYPIANKAMRDSALNFKQKRRMANFAFGIPLKDIRRDLSLRSTFFSVSSSSGEVTLSGRGYGHGVGLSQEGAVRMINLGYSVADVLKFYYTDVDIKTLEDLDPGAFSR